jgi:hypothetical protein
MTIIDARPSTNEDAAQTMTLSAPASRPAISRDRNAAGADLDLSPRRQSSDQHPMPETGIERALRCAPARGRGLGSGVGAGGELGEDGAQDRALVVS